MSKKGRQFFWGQNIGDTTKLIDRQRDGDDKKRKKVVSFFSGKKYG